MREIARREMDGEFESLRGDAPDQPGVIVRPDGSSYETTVSVAAVLRGYGWRIIEPTENIIERLWSR